MVNEIEIMDVTLRDGSYAINFQFSDQDVRIIGGALEDSGISLIEIGHGMGLGASSVENGLSLNTDEEYLRAASQTFQKAKFGMFCIPGIASVDDIKMAADYGMKFIRVGTNVDDVPKSEKLIDCAKQLGMTVFSNYMKSYTSSPKEFAEKVKCSENFGADVVYIVDSAGGMFQENIKIYYEAIREITNIAVGFHGHNNLGLAVSNSMYAAEIGIQYIDASLQGLGRSAGNASLELLIACLIKKYDISMYDCKKIVMLGWKCVYPLLKKKGLNPLDIYSGISDFHSSYMKYIHKYASRYNVSPLSLIYEYCKFDKLNMDENKLDQIAGNLPKEDVILSDFSFNNYFGDEQRT